MFKNAAIALLLVALIGGVATALVRSQSQTAEVDVRVRAKRLADGRTEFEIQQREGSGWSDSLFRSNPKLRADPVIDRWYSSGAVTATTEVLAMPGDEAIQPATSSASAPPSGWRPLSATDGDVDIRVEYSVESDPLDGQLTTIVTSRKYDDSFGYVELNQVCRRGQFDIVIDDDNYHSFYDDPPQVRYRLDDGPVQSLDVTRYAEAPYGYSPEHDTVFRLNLQTAQSLTIQFEGAGGTATGTIDLAGLFATEVQPNIDRCGQEPSAEWTPVVDTAGERDIRLHYSVAMLLGESDVSTVVTTQNVGDIFIQEELHLVCDVGRSDVIIDPANSPTTTQGVPTIYISVDDGEAVPYRWPYIRSLESGFSPDDDLAFLERLRNASSITVQVGSEKAAKLSLAGLLETPAQGNIDYCGQH